MQHFESYRSPFRTLREERTRFLGSHLRIEDIVAQVLSTTRDWRIQFLCTLCRHGTEAMLKPFLDAGIDVDEGHLWYNYLGAAAATQNVPIFNMLIRAGANTALALAAFFDHRNYLTTEVPKNLFQVILQCNNPFRFCDSLDDPFGSRDDLQDPFKSKYDLNDPFILEHHLNRTGDPLIKIMVPTVYEDFPDAPQILFGRKAFRNEALNGGRDVHVSDCYMYNAIRYSRPKIVELCLNHGFQASGLLGEV